MQKQNTNSFSAKKNNSGHQNPQTIQLLTDTHAFSSVKDPSVVSNSNMPCNSSCFVLSIVCFFCQIFPFVCDCYPFSLSGAQHIEEIGLNVTHM